MHTTCTQTSTVQLRLCCSCTAFPIHNSRLYNLTVVFAVLHHFCLGNAHVQLCGSGSNSSSSASTVEAHEKVSVLQRPSCAAAACWREMAGCLRGRAQHRSHGDGSTKSNMQRKCVHVQQHVFVDYVAHCRCC
jgi:hypothetical protein